MKNKKNRKVYCDYDSVLNNFSGDLLTWLNYTYKTNYRLGDIDKWDWVRDLQKADNNIKPYDWINKGIAYTGGKFECKPMSGASYFYDTLSDLYDTYILTNTNSKEVEGQKNLQILKYFNTTAVIHERDKWVYAVSNKGLPNILIDDKLENVLMFSCMGGKAILFNKDNEYEYNRMCKSMTDVYMASTYDEVLDLLRVI